MNVYDIKDINVKWLRQQIGVVSQEPVLFDGSISDNIRLGREGATQADIEEAAKMANAHNFITKFPDVRCCSQFQMLYFPALNDVYLIFRLMVI